jgi:hypothetical protein
MKHWISILLLSMVSPSIASSVGIRSYWTLSVSPSAIEGDVAPYQLILDINGADRVYIRNLPKGWGSFTCNDRVGRFRVVIGYMERDRGAMFRKMSIGDILSGVEVTSGPPFGDSDELPDGYLPDRSGKIEAEIEVSYGRASKDGDYLKASQYGVAKISAKGVILTFHDVDVISGDTRFGPNQPSLPIRLSVTPRACLLRRAFGGQAARVAPASLMAGW